MHDHGQIPADEALRAYEQTAVTMADAAGALITTTFGRTLSVRYMNPAPWPTSSTIRFRRSTRMWSS
jgi:hypothetical protein